MQEWASPGEVYVWETLPQMCSLNTFEERYIRDGGRKFYSLTGNIKPH